MCSPPERTYASSFQGPMCSALWDHHKISSRTEGFWLTQKTEELGFNCAWGPIVDTVGASLKFPPILITGSVCLISQNCYALLLITSPWNILQKLPLDYWNHLAHWEQEFSGTLCPQGCLWPITDWYRNTLEFTSPQEGLIANEKLVQEHKSPDPLPGGEKICDV